MLDQEILGDFISEAREHLETIEPNLLELEKSPESTDLLNDIFRPIHSLKGASGFLNLTKMNQLAHRAENVLDELRKGSLRNTPEIMDIILNSTDVLRQLLDNLEQQADEGDIDVQDSIRALDELLRPGGGASPDQAGKNDPGGQAGIPAGRAHRQEGKGYALTINSPEHLADFLEEASETVAQLNATLLKMERGSGKDLELVNDTFRFFHNLKGNSALIGYQELNELTHEAESLLNSFRTRKVMPDDSTIDLLLKVTDVVENLIKGVDASSGTVVPEDISQLLDQLVSLQADEHAGADAGSDQEQFFSLDPDRARELGVDPEDLQVYQNAMSQQFANIRLAFSRLEGDPDHQDSIDSLYRSFDSLANASSYMDFADLSDYARRTANLVDQGRRSGQGFELMLSILDQETDILQDMVQQSLSPFQTGPEEGAAEGPQTLESEAGAEAPSRRVEQPMETETPNDARAPETGSAPSPAEPETADPCAGDGGSSLQAVASQTKVTTTIRVDHERLDHLMNLIGELIINRNRYSLLTRELEEGRDISQIVQHLSETTDAMARISDDLQDTIMQVRMVPVKTVFSKFPRLVRDLSRKSGKKVELITEGEETELDKSVVEAIGDPLVHLIRNAMDHGLEASDVRERAGKSETGHIWLRASHEGNAVVIEVQDDGKGIDPEVIRTKAVEKGILSREEVDKLDDKDAVELIFAPGFSTAGEITDISGRGVGMDVVRNNIKNLNGNVTVSSQFGQGSTFTLSLPLTLAIIEALLVKVAGQTYAIPLDAVSETTKISAQQVSEVNKRQATTLRGHVLGLVELSELLGLESESEQRDILPLVIISVNDKRLGLIVDSLLHRQEIVIKSMGEYLGDLQGLSGATIMGDGSVILILDPNEVFHQAATRAA
jgi:two-component system chemotaxis sensor kinase CheA